MYKYECNGGRVRGRTLTLRLSELEPPDPESGPGGLSAESVSTVQMQGQRDDTVSVAWMQALSHVCFPLVRVECVCVVW